MIKNWTTDRLSDLTGKTYLITGSNTGLGYQAAKILRNKNANVIVAARSVDKGNSAQATLLEQSAAGSVEFLHLDLADSTSIRAASQTLRSMTDGLDGLINNAGVMQTPELKTADGFELQFGTNHLGHFLLNTLLFDLVKARNGRIVPVSSIAHLRARPIDFDDVMFERNYSPTFAYGQSKLANLIYGLELARRLETAGHSVMSVSCHPGYSDTNLQSSGPTGFFKTMYRFTNRFIAQNASAGAVPLVLAAAGEEAVNGAYYGPTALGGMRGPVGDSAISKKAKDTAVAEKLWALSEDLLGITFDL